MTFVACMAYWQLAPVFPEFLKDREMHSSLTGYCLSIFAFFLLFSAVITGNYVLKYVNRIDVCFYGAYCLVSFIFNSLYF